MGIALEFEGVVSRGDVHRRRHLKHGLEPDALLAYEAGGLATPALGALANAGDGLDMFLGETLLVAVDPDPGCRVCDRERRFVVLVRVVVGVLN